MLEVITIWNTVSPKLSFAFIKKNSKYRISKKISSHEIVIALYNI